jgi:type IV secretory pathway TraG/TraD family ATPase VirD4
MLAGERDGSVEVVVLEGSTVQGTPRASGAEPGSPSLAVVEGLDGIIRLDEDLLSRHLLFLGSIGSGKTNGMMQVVGELRQSAGPDDVFVVFDTKGDYLQELGGEDDVVLSNDRHPEARGRFWNVFDDLLAGDPDERSDEIFEIASIIFAEQLESAGENLFFAAGARDVFAAVMDALARDGSRHTNQSLRRRLESSREELAEVIGAHEDLAGARHYLTGSGNAPRAVMAFMQQSIRAAFSGAFREPGDFSVRRFVRAKGARALFVEYDIASGSLLLPIYRVLLDLAIKEALGRRRARGNVFIVMDEFSLLPQLSHVSNGVNFGRSLGLKFLVGAQNVRQVYHAYDEDVGNSILSGFGTVFAFRLMDQTSRELVSGRFGANRKQITSELAVRAKGLQQDVVLGNVIEDWTLSALRVGEAIVSLPTGAPFFFRMAPYAGRR